MGRAGLLGLGVALAWGSCSPAFAAATAGVFQFVAGEVRVAAPGGAARAAKKGTLLHVGDRIATAPRATAQVKMGDGAILQVRPDSRLTVAQYRFEGREDGSERVVFRLEQGGFRSVTGAIGNTHKNNYRIETPVAHMGVRGTDHESYYFPPGAAGAERAGAYNKVNTGITFIRNAAGEVVIAPNQVGFVASASDRPALLPAVPQFFSRDVAPRTSQAPRDTGRAAAQPSVVRPVKTADGLELAPQASAGRSVAGFVEPVGGASFGRSTRNAMIGSNGATLAGAGSDTAWGVDWGTWLGAATTVNGVATAGAVHFANAATPTTPTQLAALSAGNINATYTYLGGPAPTNQAGVAGTVNALSVGVNFGTQAVTGYTVSATVDGRAWNATGSGSLAQFTGAAGIGLSGTCAGCTAAPATAANGSAHGAFVGPAAERLISSFGLRSATHSIAGAAYLGR